MSGSQTTGAINFTDTAVWVAVNSGAFAEICGEANSISMSGGDRDVGEFKTYCGDTPIVLPGKRNKIQVTLHIAYTEGLSDPFEVARLAYENKGTHYQVRWIPRGNASGNFRYTTDANSFVSSAPYPMGAADSADITAFDVTVECAYVTKDAVP